MDQAAVPGQNLVEEVGLSVEEVQESLDIKQQSLVTSRLRQSRVSTLVKLELPGF